eukprot:5518718-Amphidinium_carterae.1
MADLLADTAPPACKRGYRYNPKLAPPLSTCAGSGSAEQLPGAKKARTSKIVEPKVCIKCAAPAYNRTRWCREHKQAYDVMLYQYCTKPRNAAKKLKDPSAQAQALAKAEEQSAEFVEQFSRDSQAVKAIELFEQNQIINKKYCKKETL